MQTERDGTPEAGKDSTDLSKELVGAFSADHHLHQVAIAALDEPLGYIKPYLARAMQKTDDYSLDDLLGFLYRGEAALLVEWAEGRPQGCAVASIQPLVEGTALHIMAIAGFPGKNFRYPNAKSFELLADQGRAWGCTCVQGFANEAVARLWSRIEFTEVARLMRKPI